jgi:hypothetical protein
VGDNGVWDGREMRLVIQKTGEINVRGDATLGNAHCHSAQNLL